MVCPHCGAEVFAGNRFCQVCRKRVVAPSAEFPASQESRSSAPQASATPPAPRAPYGTPALELKRPGVVTLLAVLDLIGGGLLLLACVFMLIAASRGKGSGAALLVLLVAVYLALSAIYLAAGVGLWRLRNWGRVLQIGLACIGLLGVPCGTIISILILIYLLKEGVRILFSGRPARDLTPDEVAEVNKLMQGSTATTVAIVIVVCLVSVFAVGMIAAIAIPSLLRARVSANEAAAVGDLRTLLSAEAAYATANGNYPDRLECLFGPSKCIPGYSATGAALLPDTMEPETRRGYLFRFNPGPPAPLDLVTRGKISGSSLSAFAYVAVPVNPGQTGIHSFCADSSGRLCASMGPGELSASGGKCPASCTSLAH